MNYNFLTIFPPHKTNGIFISFRFSCTMATHHRIGHISARETWLLLWWSFNHNAIQWRNRIDCSYDCVGILSLSSIVDMWSMLLCASFFEIITMHRIGSARMEMVQGIFVWRRFAFVRSRWFEGIICICFLILSKVIDMRIIPFCLPVVGTFRWATSTFPWHLSSWCFAKLYGWVSTKNFYFSSKIGQSNNNIFFLLQKICRRLQMYK